MGEVWVSESGIWERRLPTVERAILPEQRRLLSRSFHLLAERGAASGMKQSSADARRLAASDLDFRRSHRTCFLNAVGAP